MHSFRHPSQDGSQSQICYFKNTHQPARRVPSWEHDVESQCRTGTKVTPVRVFTRKHPLTWEITSEQGSYQTWAIIRGERGRLKIAYAILSKLNQEACASPCSVTSCYKICQEPIRFRNFLIIFLICACQVLCSLPPPKLKIP